MDAENPVIGHGEGLERVGGGLEEGWRRVGEGLEEGWRRVGGGLEEGWRRVGEGLKKGWRRVGEGLEKGHFISYEGSIIFGPWIHDIPKLEVTARKQDSQPENSVDLYFPQFSSENPTFSGKLRGQK